MRVETFAKEVWVSVNPCDHVYTIMVQFGEHGEELPYSTLVEMPFNTAVKLRKELGEWLPILQAKIENRHSTPTTREVTE